MLIFNHWSPYKSNQSSNSYHLYACKQIMLCQLLVSGSFNHIR